MYDMPRRYVQRHRARSAEGTRRRILDAARRALLADGPPDVNVGDIAATAGVARSTVYTAFGSRAGLLAAMADDTLHRAGLANVVAEYRRPDAVEALERSLVASCRMYAADHRVFGRLLVLAAIDPDAAGPLARSQADRTGAMVELATRLAAQHRLRAGMEVGRAADLLCLLTTFATFDELHSARGLGADACAEILVAITRATVLADV